MASKDLVERLRTEAGELTCYASTTTEHRPNATAALLEEAAKEIASLAGAYETSHRSRLHGEAAVERLERELKDLRRQMRNLRA